MPSAVALPGALPFSKRCKAPPPRVRSPTRSHVTKAAAARFPSSSLISCPDISSRPPSSASAPCSRRFAIRFEPSISSKSTASCFNLIGEKTMTVHSPIWKPITVAGWENGRNLCDPSSAKNAMSNKCVTSNRAILERCLPPCCRFHHFSRPHQVVRQGPDSV